MSDDPISFTVYMTPADEAPLLDFLRQDGGKIVRMFSSEWPPVPLKRPPEACGDDECLAVWYSDVISEAELEHPDCRPIRGRHGRFDAWSLPLVTFQRQWYWKKQATIFAVELDERAFCPNRPESEPLTAEEFREFHSRLNLLRARAFAIQTWCRDHLREGYIGEHAWKESESLRQTVAYQAHLKTRKTESLNGRLPSLREGGTVDDDKNSEGPSRSSLS